MDCRKPIPTGIPVNYVKVTLWVRYALYLRAEWWHLGGDLGATILDAVQVAGGFCRARRATQKAFTERGLAGNLRRRDDTLH